VIEGNGAVVAEGGDRPISQGDFVLVKPGELHQYKNTSQDNFVVLCAVPKDYE
jgi:quercetin dioxygenase-like cupin family protein